VKDRIARLLATVFGAGLSPVAPGTAGTLAAVPLFWALSQGGLPLELLGLLLVTALAVPCAGHVAARAGHRDPQTVVIDEAAGYLLAMLGHPATWPWMAAGFLLFRLFDIVKPFPVRRLEALPGGWGIVADDLMAGAYAWLCLFALRKAVGA
jgi:phosphatidylglycerophosphatase A